jgi:hypothetical protein
MIFDPVLGFSDPKLSSNDELVQTLPPIAIGGLSDDVHHAHLCRTAIADRSV